MPADEAPPEAAGHMTEALETLERARGHLYSFHQLVGSADSKLDAVLEALRAAGRSPLADEIERELLGRNVLEGRWTFQIIEEFNDGYYAVFRDFERRVREALVGGRRHAHEAALKERRRTPDHPAHTPRPSPPLQ
jgi:hypothetical protein